MSKSRGIFVLIEGGDRSGKTTQCTTLLASMIAQNLNVEFIHFPERSTTIGKVIDSVLKGEIKEISPEVIHLLYSANRWEFKDRIIEKLKQGTSILMDRYAYSGIAYSMARGLDVEWCKTAEKGLPKPDIILFLDISAEEAAKRTGYGEEIYEKIEFQKKVIQNFKTILYTEKEESNWFIIDANNDQNIISHIISKHIYETMSKITESTPISLI